MNPDPPLVADLTLQQRLDHWVALTHSSYPGQAPVSDALTCHFVAGLDRADGRMVLGLLAQLASASAPALAQLLLAFPEDQWLMLCRVLRESLERAVAVGNEVPSDADTIAGDQAATVIWTYLQQCSTLPDPPPPDRLLSELLPASFSHALCWLKHSMPDKSEHGVMQCLMYMAGTVQDMQARQHNLLVHANQVVLAVQQLRYLLICNPVLVDRTAAMLRGTAAGLCTCIHNQWGDAAWKLGKACHNASTQQGQHEQQQLQLCPSRQQQQEEQQAKKLAVLQTTHKRCCAVLHDLLQLALDMVAHPLGQIEFIAAMRAPGSRGRCWLSLTLLHQHRWLSAPAAQAAVCLTAVLYNPTAYLPSNPEQPQQLMMAIQYKGLAACLVDQLQKHGTVAAVGELLQAAPVQDRVLVSACLRVLNHILVWATALLSVGPLATSHQTHVRELCTQLLQLLLQPTNSQDDEQLGLGPGNPCVVPGAQALLRHLWPAVRQGHVIHAHEEEAGSCESLAVLVQQSWAMLQTHVQGCKQEQQVDLPVPSSAAPGAGSGAEGRRATRGQMTAAKQAAQLTGAVSQSQWPASPPVCKQHSNPVAGITAYQVSLTQQPGAIPTVNATAKQQPMGGSGGGTAPMAVGCSAQHSKRRAEPPLQQCQRPKRVAPSNTSADQSTNASEQLCSAPGVPACSVPVTAPVTLVTPPPAPSQQLQPRPARVGCAASMNGQHLASTAPSLTFPPAATPSAAALGSGVAEQLATGATLLQTAGQAACGTPAADTPVHGAGSLQAAGAAGDQLTDNQAGSAKHVAEEPCPGAAEQPLTVLAAAAQTSPDSCVGSEQPSQQTMLTTQQPSAQQLSQALEQVLATAPPSQPDPAAGTSQPRPAVQQSQPPLPWGRQQTHVKQEQPAAQAAGQLATSPQAPQQALTTAPKEVLDLTLSDHDDYGAVPEAAPTNTASVSDLPAALPVFSPDTAAEGFELAVQLAWRLSPSAVRSLTTENSAMHQAYTAAEMLLRLQLPQMSRHHGRVAQQYRLCYAAGLGSMQQDLQTFTDMLAMVLDLTGVRRRGTHWLQQACAWYDEHQ